MQRSSLSTFSIVLLYFIFYYNIAIFEAILLWFFFIVASFAILRTILFNFLDTIFTSWIYCCLWLQSNSIHLITFISSSMYLIYLVMKVILYIWTLLSSSYRIRFYGFMINKELYHFSTVVKYFYCTILLFWFLLIYLY